ncbi:hypothetical protein SISSUDRAFT_1034970 [Sistotremastrum suecicum HHB10207 ss-3]|uniref:glucan endo-1,3-beta-D-glucosidase n=1 Tax=Sistotremastrum suecicum HHB10207 ss-3 TaxID=1314776 RepID=A0A166BE97_9AGAM|nr:hypothetical protein SISSUDRAFT_1034970 [Sistotremastrum suecicum HHB10207 ss-3]
MRFLQASLLTLGYFGTANAIFGPIATDAPAPAGGNVACAAPPLTSFFAGHSGPFPTDNWWVGYGVAPGNAVCAGPFPYESNMANSSIQFGVSSERDFDGTSIHQPTQTDWSVGFVEHSGNFNDHKTLGWDSQSITVQYFTGASTMTSYLVPGSPYLTFNFAAATPLFTSGQGVITSFAGKTVTNNGAAVSSTGTEFAVVNNIGTYLIYSLNGAITLSASSTGATGTIKASAPFNGVLRVAKLNSTSHQPLLDQYAANYPTAVTTDYTFSGDTATLSFTWTVTGNAANLLMLTWPHHRIKMVNPNFPATTALNYLTTKGYMYPAIGNVWNLQYALPTITFNAPRAPDTSCVSTIIQGLQYDIGKLSASAPSIPGDFYYWGGSIAAQGRLALIAEAVGRTDLIPQVTGYLEASYNYWFQASSSTLPAYETAWGGIINKAGYNNPNVDFGNGYYNDHHFHYGYFLTGAAIIAKYDKNWMNAHQTYINWFARDIANPSTADPYFTVARHRDWFAGHSWASGIANGAGSRDQEASTEAINGYYGAMLWGNVTGNTNLFNFARLLVATEQHASQTYWHLYPQASATARDQPYPEVGLRNLITIGNVEDWQAGAWTFWGAEKVEINSIQILPVTPINEYLYDSQWVQNVYAYTSGELADPTIDDEWKCLIYLAYSQYSPQTANTLSASLTDWGSGNTFSNQQYFIATRPNPTPGTPICSAGAAPPLGLYYIQSASSGDYVVSTAANPNLVASATSTAGATVFNLTFVPNGVNIFSTANQQYVTADQSGVDPIVAARAVASTWESFIVTPKVGAAAGTYSLLSGANSLYIQVGTGNQLINSGTTESSSTGFKFVKANAPGGPSTTATTTTTTASTGPTQTQSPPPNPSSITGTYVIQSGGLFVVSSNGAPNLIASATSASTGTSFTFSAVAGGGVNILNTLSNEYVTADISGTLALSSTRPAASTWETYFFSQQANAAPGTYVMQAESNSDYIAVAADYSLINSATSAAGAQGFNLVPAAPGYSPAGNYKLKVATSGQYVVSTAANTNLVASTTATGSATIFAFTANGNGVTLLNTANNEYVTADISGTLALASTRPVASTWETYVVRQKIGAAAGVYSLAAVSNGLYVVVNGSGQLVNSGATEASSTGFNITT